MESHWAAEHLQVIRTIMERSAVYRRALAPIMIVNGSIGLLASVGACFVPLREPRAFAVFWMCVGAVSLLVSLLLVRRQALKEQENFWSPPTRRVSEAMLPNFFVGLAAGLFWLAMPTPPLEAVLALIWVICYGCALNAAGFFMQRGMKLFGWAFAIAGCGLLFVLLRTPSLHTMEAAHYIMGIFFGVLHMAYGVYLYFTERSRRTA